jgi:hypothetical protein
MKKAFFLFLALALFTACPSPVLKWIDTPRGAEPGGEDKSGEGRMAGQWTDKEIVSFTFGLGPDAENDLPISKSPDLTGKFPIKVILSGVEDLTSLEPSITFIGKSLSPGSGTPGDFSSAVYSPVSEYSPVIYTVTAEDGSSREYAVTIYKKTDTSKEILRFDLELGSGLAAEGIIVEQGNGTGTITATVPAGTDLTSLTVHVAHTGFTMMDPQRGSYPQITFDYTGNFSTPTTWTILDHQGTAKVYTLTVNREPSGAREITRFSFGITGEEAVIGGEPQPDGKYPILVLVPSSPGLTLNRSPFIDYTGVSISPAETAPENFGDPLHPVSYTVAAENGSTRDYVVKVLIKDPVPADTDAEITGFYFRNPLVEGVIDQTAKTIALTVPEGTPLNALVPEIYFKGASVSPKSGQPQNFTGSDTSPVPYTVRAAGGVNKTTYQVSVFAPPAPPTVDTGTETAEVGIGTDASGNYTIIVEFPVHIENPVININYPGSTQPVSPNGNVYYETTVNVTDTVVIVNPPANPPVPSQTPGSAASIDAFYFTAPPAIGEIGNTGDGTQATPYSIEVTVPYGTNLSSLAAAVVYTGNRIDGVPGHSPLKDNTRSFQTPVDYMVIAEDDTAEVPNRKYYRVTVTPEKNKAKDISAFSFNGINNTSAIISAQPNAEGDYPIVVTVPTGTGLTSLTPVITHTGASITGPSSFSDTNGPGMVTAFAETFSQTTPLEYEIKAEDGTTKTYAVTVREAVSTDEDIEITGFYFTEPLAVGKITGGANLITVTVPSGTNRGSLKPSVYFTGMTLTPGSGTVNDFTGPAGYTVTGVTGITRTYTVVVNPTPSGSKDITGFKLSGVVNTGLIIGAAPDPDGTYPISVQVPAGTNLSSLGTEITHTGVSLSPLAGAPQNFSVPVTYTVTAEDGTIKRYKVTVRTENTGAVITSFIFDAVPLSVGGPVRVVASIDQTTKIISAAVPSTADISALKSVITYIGQSITSPSGPPSSTANPFTDSTGRNFGLSQQYTVNAAGGGSETYTVNVTKQSAFTVRFDGETDIQFITPEFDQNTGILTVTVNDTNVDPPYDWYIDGVKQVVPADTKIFSVNLGNGSFYPGRYEIMVSGKKNGLHYTGKVYFVVSGGA